MPSQSPSALIPSDISLGNCILYYCPTHFTSFTAAKSSTKWRKLGLMQEGVDVQGPQEIAQFFSGMPSKIVQQYVTGQNLSITGSLLELNIRNLSRVLGGLTVSETVKASSPSPTTVATGSTKSVINVASATGYAAGDEIRVGDSGSYQYGRIKSISSNAITLYEGLDGDANPTTGHAVAKIDTSYVDIGQNPLPAYIALKASYTLTGGYGEMNMYLIKAQMTGGLSMRFADNTQSPEPIGLPFTAQALSDADAESGNVVRIEFTKS